MICMLLVQIKKVEQIRRHDVVDNRLVRSRIEHLCPRPTGPGSEFVAFLRLLFARFARIAGLRKWRLAISHIRGALLRNGFLFEDLRNISTD